MKKMDKDLGVYAKLAAAALAAAWGHFHPLVQALILLMFIDVLTGFLSAYVSKELCSDVSRRGAVKKVLALLMVGATEILARHGATLAPGIPELPLGSAAAGFYCVHELISITENVAKAGLPVPPGVKSVLQKLKPNAQTEPPKAA